MGILYFGAKVHPSRIDETIDIILKEAEQVKAGRFSTEFFEGKKNQVRSEYLDLRSGGQNRVSCLVSKVFDNPYYDFRKIAEAVAGLTPEQVVGTAREYFQNPLILVISAPGFRR